MLKLILIMSLFFGKAWTLVKTNIIQRNRLAIGKVHYATSWKPSGESSDSKSWKRSPISSDGRSRMPNSRRPDSRRPDDFTRTERFNRYDRRDEEKPDPVYGRYDGDHIYGIAPVKLAIMAGRRKYEELIIQTGMTASNKKDKTAMSEILELAKKNDIPVREFPKHDLNMLTDSRPHQGFVLRASPLQFKRISELKPVDQYSCVLALDEVWDPQNFGALLRTCYFLKCDKVVVCSKNSAPLSPSVSKASAGAMELMEIYSTDNMMKFLDSSRINGWQVVGTAVGEDTINMTEVPRDIPTVLVLGNEGHGLRTNVVNRCNYKVKIDSGRSGDANENIILNSYEVDSLNVSVTGGIILHHFLSK